MHFKERLSKNQIEILETFIKKGTVKSQETKRAQAVLLIEQQDSKLLLERLIGLKYRTVVRLRKNFIKHGIEAIKSKRKDKKPKALLTRNQRKQITEVLNNETPQKYGYNSPFWTTWILCNLILEQYGVKYKSRTSIYAIFKESKFTYHKPEKVSCKHDQKQIDEWEHDTKPIIESVLQDSNAIMLAEDEMILSTQTTVQKAWLPQGQSAYIEDSTKRKKLSIYGFLNIKTGQEHAFVTKHQTSFVTCNILKKVGQLYPKKKIVILWDNAPWHHGSEVREFLGNTLYNFYLIALPPYAPEENPQEHVWKAGREHVTHNKFIKNIEFTAKEFVTYLNNSSFQYKLLGLTP